MRQGNNWPAYEIVRRPTDQLSPSETNARRHSAEQISQIRRSIVEYGWTIPILIDEHNRILAGHGRHLAATDLSIPEVPCIVARGWSEEQCRAYALADNRIAENAEWDIDALRVELEFVEQAGLSLESIGFAPDDVLNIVDQLRTEAPNKGSGALVRQFGVPPFSVLNAREGRWTERKRQWLELGLRSEAGRDDSLTYSSSSDFMTQAIKDAGGGTSIFDPVLCELMYSWLCPGGGTVLDPFAGGSVRGIVSAIVGRPYIGIDLRPEQVEENQQQAKTILQKEPIPKWICGDSANLDDLLERNDAVDFVFSCPPYGDLEVYSDDPNDLSNMDYEDFREAYFRIIAKSCARLKADRFAAFVVGEIRDRKGIYRNFVGDTIEAFNRAGLRYYNEAILVTKVGSLPLRSGRQFAATRKMGKSHQNILIFVKGDAKAATSALPPIDLDWDEDQVA